MADGASGVIGLENRLERELKFETQRALLNFCGPFDQTLSDIEKHLDVIFFRDGAHLTVQGDRSQIERISEKLDGLVRRAHEGETISSSMLNDAPVRDALTFKTAKGRVSPRTASQSDYCRKLLEEEINFGIGPAGTGKTYLAVAAGVHMLQNRIVDRLIFSRPAVEAGERLGFLPGDMKEKVDPYMQPLYDALGDMIPAKSLSRMIEEKTIEIAPLAFMRGRTLTGAFVLLDEAQNATSMQMKMFLTRLGEGSRMAITGDPGQVDLPKGVTSGLSEAVGILESTRGIGVSRFTSADVVRHPLVAAILKAYETQGN